MDRRDFVTSIFATSALGKAVLALTEHEPDPSAVDTPPNERITTERIGSKLEFGNAVLRPTSNPNAGAVVQSGVLETVQFVTVRRDKNGTPLEYRGGPIAHTLTVDRLIAPRAVLKALLDKPFDADLVCDARVFRVEGVVPAETALVVEADGMVLLDRTVFVLTGYKI